jgi:hypothetical protein
MSEPVAGIYAIRNTITGRVYIGSSLHLRRRWGWHQSALRLGFHGCARLLADWRAQGPTAFAFEVLEVTEPDPHRLLEAERRHRGAIEAGSSYHKSDRTRIGRSDLNRGSRSAAPDDA